MNQIIGSRLRRPLHDSALWQAYMASRYAVLFYSLLLMLVVTPIADMLGLPQIGIRMLFGFCLVAAVMPNGTRRSRYVLLAAVVLIVAIRLASEREDVPISPGSMLGLVGAIGILAAAGTLRFVVKSKQVDRETIYAALSTYLLAGIFFGQIHWSIESIWPGSYSAPSPLSEVSAVYFSFVTLATLGYGDILPRSDLARGVTTFEVIGGQLYLAVMVARLIGLFPGTKQHS